MKVFFVRLNRKKKITLIIIIMAAFCSILLFFLYRNLFFTNYKWNDVVVSETTDSLYRLTNQTGNELYIASDAELDTKKITLQKGWEFKVVNKNNSFWSPTVCAKMPSLLLGNYLFFRGAERDNSDNMLKNSIYKYNTKTGELKNMLVPGFDIVSDVYSYNNKLYFFIYKNHQVYVYISNVDDYSKFAFQKVQFTFPINSVRDINFRYDTNGEIFTKYLDESLRERIIYFDFSTLTFVEKKSYNEENRLSISGGLKTIKMRNSDFKYSINLNNLSNYIVYYKNQKVLGLKDVQNIYIINAK